MKNKFELKSVLKIIHIHSLFLCGPKHKLLNNAEISTTAKDSCHVRSQSRFPPKEALV